MAGRSNSTLEPPTADPASARIRRTWRLLAGTFAVLAITALAAVALDPGQPLDVAVLILVGAAALAALIHQRSVVAVEAGRRSEAENVARILQGLSRSESPDAIVAAIVHDLGAGTGSDYSVVVRLRPDEAALEATLVSSRPGIANSTTRLPITDLDPIRRPEDRWLAVRPERRAERELVAIPIATGQPVPAWSALPDDDPDGGEDRDTPGDGAAGVGGVDGGSLRVDPVTSRLEARVQEVFGLSNTIAAPLRVSGRIIGALILARRTDEAWPPASRRILHGAALEAAAALGRAESHQAAEVRASTDVLTGLPNRRYFEEFCGLLSRRRRADDAVGVLMVDIDHFKQINDSHGHDVGDEVLKAVASAIASAVREGDVPARFGGEEFAILLRNPSGPVAVEVGERIRAAVGGVTLEDLGVERVSVSVGVAVQESPEQAIADLVAEADRALYRAKRAGRDRVVAA